MLGFGFRFGSTCRAMAPQSVEAMDLVVDSVSSSVALAARTAKCSLSATAACTAGTTCSLLVSTTALAARTTKCSVSVTAACTAGTTCSLLVSTTSLAARTTNCLVSATAARTAAISGSKSTSDTLTTCSLLVSTTCGHMAGVVMSCAQRAGRCGEVVALTDGWGRCVFASTTCDASSKLI